METRLTWLRILLLLVAALFIAVTFRSLLDGTGIGDQHRANGEISVSTTIPKRWYVYDNYQTVFGDQPVSNSPTSPDDIRVSVRNSNGEELIFHSDTEEAWQIGNMPKRASAMLHQRQPMNSPCGWTATTEIAFSHLSLRICAAIFGFGYADLHLRQYSLLAGLVSLLLAILGRGRNKTEGSNAMEASAG
ncbi:hypothetical protein CA13_10870 [Planctomycetes bacterium CA13]|uniref:Uncharacterized protein n=1 Tax=Novipirellula herctigrandis TaxID=2527986 RepID=A0A5C5YYL1_9BACT|nr:hypothetical protein CA13_10870 [Planctomycetes bacterium CA13]